MTAATQTTEPPSTRWADSWHMMTVEMIDFCLGYLVNSCYPINREKQMARTKDHSLSRSSSSSRTLFSAICVNLKLIFIISWHPTASCRRQNRWLMASNDFLTPRVKRKLLD